MKKTLIALLFLGIVFAPVGIKAADIGTGISTEAISEAQTQEELKAQIIVLLKQLIAILQEQLNQMIIQEARIQQIEATPQVVSGQVATDTIAPVIKFGMFGDKITQNIYVRGYELASGANRFELYLNGTLFAQFNNNQSVEDGVWLDFMAVADGRYNLTIKAWDRAGNFSEGTTEINVEIKR